MWFLILWACQGGSEVPAKLDLESKHLHSHAGDPEAHSHAGHPGAHSEHMANMSRIRDGLRSRMGEEYDQPVLLGTADRQRGESLYQQHCLSCHGVSGKGDGPAAGGLATPPADFTDGFHARFYSDAGRVEIINTGVVEFGMPGFGSMLSKQEILDIYAHIHSLRPAIPQ